MIELDGPWFDFEECGWCHKRSDVAVLYRSTEAGRIWSSVWFACVDCVLAAPALISTAGSAQSVKIEAVWFWSHSSSWESGSGPGQSLDTLRAEERKWLSWLNHPGADGVAAWAAVREGWRAGITRLT
jgi:hypothetical protein